MDDETGAKPPAEDTSESPHKKAALWFFSALIISYLPGVSASTIAGVKVENDAVHYLQLFVWLAGMYYAFTFYVLRQHARATTTQAVGGRELNASIRNILQGLDVGPMIRERSLEITKALAGTASSIRDDINNRAKDFNPSKEQLLRSVSLTIKEMLGTHFAAAAAAENREDLDRIWETGQPYIAEIVANMEQYLENELKFRVSEAEEAAAKIEHAAQTAAWSINGLHAYITRLEAVYPTMRKLRTQTRRMTLWMPLKENWLDFGVLLAGAIITTGLIVLITVPFLAGRVISVLNLQ